jgi:hypothetical protein
MGLQDRQAVATRGRPILQGIEASVRKEEIAQPAKGGSFDLLDGSILTIVSDPRTDDADRLIWTMTVSPLVAPTFDPLTTEPFLFALPKPGQMWQDAAGLMPVTANGQLVARMVELGQIGHVGFAPSLSQRPTYRTDGARHWLEVEPGSNACIVFDLVDNIDEPFETVSAWRVNSDNVGFGFPLYGDTSNNYGLYYGVNFNGLLSMRSPAGNLSLPATPALGTDFVATDRWAPADAAYLAANGDAGVSGTASKLTSMLSLGGDGIGGPDATKRCYGLIRWLGVQSEEIKAKARTYIGERAGLVL